MSFPEPPPLTLRLGVAGQRSLAPAHIDAIRGQLREVYAAIDGKLHEIWKGFADQRSSLGLFDSGHGPRLRLVTGLADGADHLAATVFLEEQQRHPERELAAVLPFDSTTYRDCSPVVDRETYDTLLARCSYVLELDGAWRPKDSGDPDRDASAIASRARAYRQQSQILVRHCDLLVLIGNRQATARPGGTLETARHALELGIPLLWIEAGCPRVALVRTLAEWIDFDPFRHVATDSWQDDLRGFLADLTTNPLRARHIGEQELVHPPLGPDTERDGYRDLLLGAYALKEPPRRSRRQAVWEFFERWIAPPVAPGEARIAPDHGPVAACRQRAAELSRHFVGRYRGTFLLNYALAALAVTAAAGSLTLLVLAGHVAPWVLVALFVLVFLKLLMVLAIYFNTRLANEQAWSEVATDFRYLSERLRPLAFLTPLGGLRPPPPGSEQYATRVERQSTVDWLADAIIRGLPPLAALRASGNQKLVRIDAAQVLENRTLRWLDEQVSYHRANTERMRRMDEKLESLSAALITSLLTIVCADLVLIIAHWLQLIPEGLHGLVATLKPVLIGVSAAIPAFVASMNGIRFQSECQRIADRSAFMHHILSERRRSMLQLVATIKADRAAGANQLGSWNVAALVQAELLAKVTVEEAAEWSVLYAKHLFES